MEKNDFYKDIKKEGYGHVTDYKGARSEMYYIPQVSQLPERLQHSHWTVDKCIEFLDRRDEEKPFFMMASFEKPHPPFEPPVPWNRLYRGPDMPLPKQAPDNEDVITLWNRFQNRYKYRDQGTDQNLVRQIKAHYYGEVSFMDYNLGRLLKQLETRALLKDTLIIFTADHGEMLVKTMYFPHLVYLISHFFYADSSPPPSHPFLFSCSCYFQPPADAQTVVAILPFYRGPVFCPILLRKYCLYCLNCTPACKIVI